MRLHLLGDLHGDFRFYLQWIAQKDPHDYTVVLGDFGLGFSYLYDKVYTEGIYGWTEHNKFIRGNHDNPEVCRKQPGYLGEFGYWKNKIFFISGAWSIDKDIRTPGKDWWWDEELTIPQCEECIRLYKNSLPDIVISHDCPYSIRDMVVRPINIKPCRTQLLMDELLNIHRPSKFIFAHYHTGCKINHKGTEFRCLNIKEPYYLEFDENS